MRALPPLAGAAIGVLLLTGCSDAGAGGAIEASPVPAVTTLVDKRGTGATTTGTFDAKARWDVDYTYDCATQPKGAGRFQVFVQDVDGRRLNVLADNEGPSGEKVSRWPHGGTYALEVVTPCSWTLKVTG